MYDSHSVRDKLVPVGPVYITRIWVPRSLPKELGRFLNEHFNPISVIMRDGDNSVVDPVNVTVR